MVRDGSDGARATMVAILSEESGSLRTRRGVLEDVAIVIFKRACEYIQTR